jgi:hypothetical protein
MCVIGCLSSFKYCCQKYILFGFDQCIVGIRKDASGEWFVENKRGELNKATLKRTSVNTSLVIILHLRNEDKDQANFLTIFRDSITEKQFRKLSAILNYY